MNETIPVENLEGIELARAVAMEVMGWKKEVERTSGHDDFSSRSIPGWKYGTGFISESAFRPDRDIAAAKQAMAKLWESGKFAFIGSGLWLGQKQVDVAISPVGDISPIRIYVDIVSDPIPAECVAVCRACILAARWLKEQGK